jgi:hypothetical protein
MSPAPVGNKNALKHGLYARRITLEQSKILVKMEALDVQQEILVLRAVLDNILGEIEKAEEPAVKAVLYNSLFAGVTSLNTTIRTHALLFGRDSDLEREVEAGKLFVRQRLRVYDYLVPQVSGQSTDKSDSS